MTEVATITISAVNYSVYGLTSDALTDADNYHAANLAAESWTTATTLEKQQALITAFRAFERESWTGTPDAVATAQWPRTDATCKGEAITDSVIPTNIVLGQFEYALAALDNASILTDTSTALGIKKVEAGSAKVTYHYPLNGESSRWPLPITDLISCYLTSSTGTSSMLPYVSGGADNTYTPFDTGRTDGFA
jgi:hypothetical protein